MASKHVPGERLGRYILEGHKAVPCEELILWASWLQRSDRRVARTELGHEVYVSTVFLGLDHNHSRNGPPLLFETMVFGPELQTSYRDLRGKLRTSTHHPDLYDIQRRYSTWEQAEAGHAEICNEVRAKLAELDAKTAALFKSKDTTKKT